MRGIGEYLTGGVAGAGDGSIGEGVAGGVGGKEGGSVGDGVADGQMLTFLGTSYRCSQV